MYFENKIGRIVYFHSMEIMNNTYIKFRNGDNSDSTGDKESNMGRKEIFTAKALEDEGSSLAKTLFECICPKCGTRHNTYLYWNGRGTPRKFCRSCRDFVQNTHLDTIFSLDMYNRKQ